MNAALFSVSIYVVLNVITFLAYAWDKHKAVRGKWRTKERTLLLLGLIGPFGAVSGMSVFHHKTQKPKFRLNYVFLVLHCLIIVGMIYSHYIH